MMVLRFSSGLMGACTAVVAALLAISGQARAQVTPPDYGFGWSTISSPGNRGIVAAEASFGIGIGRGAVDHTYRLAQTEITNAQWLEFVQAYGPYYLQDHPTHDQEVALTGDGINYLFGSWVFYPSTNPSAPANMSWRYAAMYYNWLCNGKRTDRAAFESGAYDVSTFTQNPDGSYNDQAAHTPGAAFWIPTLDEWIKAAYYDPKKVGPDGLPGAYWQFIGARDTQMPGGLPGQGGLSNIAPYGGGNTPTSVASYPACGPWGLFDQSGGRSEWTETSPLWGHANTERSIVGSVRGQQGPAFGPDWIENHFYASDNIAYASDSGFRLASAVPSPGITPALVLVSLVNLKSRRR